MEVTSSAFVTLDFDEEDIAAYGPEDGAGDRIRFFDTEEPCGALHRMVRFLFLTVDTPPSLEMGNPVGSLNRMLVSFLAVDITLLIMAAIHLAARSSMSGLATTTDRITAHQRIHLPPPNVAFATAEGSKDGLSATLLAQPLFIVPHSTYLPAADEAIQDSSLGIKDAYHGRGMRYLILARSDQAALYVAQRYDKMAPMIL